MIERMRDMLRRMCEAAECADCPLGVYGCELAAMIGYKGVPNERE